MKRLITLLAMGILFYACSENTNLVDPTDQSSNNAYTAHSPKSNFSWISQAASKSEKFIDQEQIEEEKKIDLKKGGTITASWRKKGGKEINAELIVPKGAKKDVQSLKFYMLVDNNNLTVKFEPHPTDFDIPLTLNLEFKGLDLTGINPDKIRFAYLDDPSTGFKVINGQIKVDIKKGNISVTDVNIDHFSQYGFVRKDDPENP